MNDEQRFDPRTIFILFFLLLVRIIYRVGIMFFGFAELDFADYYVLALIYLLSAFAIYLERKRLFNINIDRRYFLLFVFSGFFGVIIKPLIFGIVPLICAICLYLLLRQNQLVFQEAGPAPIIWLVRSILVGFALPILSSMIFRIRLAENADILYSISVFLAAFTQTVLLEEIIFRGLLCGYLSFQKWPPNRIIVVQAFLFWIAHIDYADKTVYFWFVIPLVGIVFGLIVQKSKSIFWSTITHSIYNSLI